MGLFRQWNFLRTQKLYRSTSCKNFRCCFILIFEIFFMKVRVPKCSWTQFQTGQFGIFTINYFFIHFKLCNFDITEDSYRRTSCKNFICCFDLLYAICYVEFRVSEWSWDQFQIGQLGIFTITSLLWLFKLWKFHRIGETYRSTFGKNFIIIFEKLDMWHVVQVSYWQETQKNKL